MSAMTYTYLYECSKGCGYKYKSPLKVDYVQCPNKIHYPRIASPSVEATFVKKVGKRSG